VQATRQLRPSPPPTPPLIFIKLHSHALLPPRLSCCADRYMQKPAAAIRPFHTNLRPAHAHLVTACSTQSFARPLHTLQQVHHDIFSIFSHSSAASRSPFCCCACRT
jgi:hypothetical protein